MIQKLPFRLLVGVAATVLVILSLQPVVARADPIGLGTYASPYQISSCLDLSTIPNNVNSGTVYELTANFSCATTSFTPIVNFGGTFYGNGYTISDLSISTPSNSNVGLFGSTTSQAYITGITLTGETIVGQDNVGGLIGYNNGSTVQYCSANANVTGDNYVGGLVGESDSAYMSAVSSSGTVTGLSGGSFGGLVGYGTRTSISESYSSANLIDDSSSLGDYGGLIGNVYRGNYQQDYSSGDLTSPSSNTTNHDNVGGLFGYINQTRDTLSFSVSPMSNQDNTNGGNTGGFAGFDSDASSSGPHSSITDVFYDISITNQANRCVGSITNSGGIISGNCNGVDSDGSQLNYFYSNTNVPVSNFTFSSSTWLAQVDGLPILNSLPAAPTSLKMVSGSSTSLTLSWTAPDSDGGLLPTSDYQVLYWPTANPGAVQSVDTLSTSTQAKVFDLMTNQSYSFVVQASYQQYGGEPWGQFSQPLVVGLSSNLPASQPSPYTWKNLTSNTSYSSLGLDNITSSSSGQYLAANGVDGYIYTSNDYGQTWTNNNDSSGSHSWYRLAGSSSGQYLLASVIGGDIYTSNDYGQTWTDTASVSTVSDILNISVSGNGQYMLAASEGDQGDVYVSDDYGQTWTSSGLESITGLTTWSTVASSNDGQYMYAGNYNHDIYKSSDYGLTWTDVSSSIGGQGWLKMSSSTSGQYITALVEGGDIYTSNDYGTTWVDATNGLQTNWSYLDISSTGQYQVASAYGEGVYFSGDYGATWSMNSGTGIGSWSSVAISANGEYVYAVNNENQAVYMGTVSPPIISNITSNVATNGSITVNVLNGVVGADSSTLSIVTPPIHGSAYDPPGTITYTPDVGYTGSDSLVYRVCSSIDNTICSEATLSFNVVSTSTISPPNTGFGSPTSGSEDNYSWTIIIMTSALASMLVMRRTIKLIGK
jgi:photosystem II stability/assembly factor-like uncharacterized protein